LWPAQTPLSSENGTQGCCCPQLVSFYDAFVNPTEGTVRLAEVSWSPACAVSRSGRLFCSRDTSCATGQHRAGVHGRGVASGHGGQRGLRRRAGSRTHLARGLAGALLVDWGHQWRSAVDGPRGYALHHRVGPGVPARASPDPPRHQARQCADQPQG
jgi:hypothetical protein